METLLSSFTISVIVLTAWLIILTNRIKRLERPAKASVDPQAIVEELRRRHNQQKVSDAIADLNRRVMGNAYETK